MRHPNNDGCSRPLLNWRRVIAAGLIAGCAATIAQLILWWLFLDAALPWMLYRDARLTAAILLGSGVLPPPVTFDLKVMLVATLIHFTLSIVYSAILACLIARLNMTRSLLGGGLFGLALYGVNMYGFTWVFPWFSLTRDWITLAAHVVFGWTLAVGLRAFGANPTCENTAHPDSPIN